MDSKQLRRFLAAVVVMAALPASPGSAGDDGGIGEFFREQFGIGASPRAAPDLGSILPDERPVIIRPRRRPAITRRPEAKIAVGPVAPVSIYEDRTLRAGDAVMTTKGVRVFLGGHSAPFTEADFAALTDSEGLPKQVQKALLVIDKAPRS